MSEITLQDIFDASWEHFILRDEPPAMLEGECVYVTDDGRKCAVGLVIPDGHPAQQTDLSFRVLTENYPELWAADVMEVDGNSLIEFQDSLHDSIAENGVWTLSKSQRKAEYAEVAHKFGLTIPERNKYDNTM